MCVCSGRWVDTCASAALGQVREKDGGQVALAEVRDDRHDRLAGVLRPLGHIDSSLQGSTGGDAHEQALLPGGAAGGLDRVFAGDGDHLVVDAGVQDLRNEVGPETLDLVRTSLASGE